MQHHRDGRGQPRLLHAVTDKRASIRRLLDAAARVARDEALVRELVSSTGLSRENVMLGLSRHLETEATDAELDALIAGVTETPRVHVILSASVFVAPLRAIALALAATNRVTVKPSRREPHFARALVRELAHPNVSLTLDLQPEDVPEGEIHVYGRNDTISRVRERASEAVTVRGHGAGMGVALVTGDLATAALALASDIVPFEQRGCLSPKVVFTVGSDGTDFARLLFDALEERAQTIPRGALDQGETQDLALWAATMEYAGELHRGASCAVGVLGDAMVPPSGRHVQVRPLPTAPDLALALGQDARFVVAVGSDTLDVARAVAPAHARVSALGMMQRPPLDGPVDLRGS
jgi:hypothetical protein